MKKFFRIAFVYSMIIITSICSNNIAHANLLRADINELPDKKFYLTAVNIISPCANVNYESSAGITANLSNDILNALPVENILKIISDDYKIKLDTTEFKKADLKNAGSSWKSDLKNINTIVIDYKITETFGSGFRHEYSYFNTYLTITLTTATGESTSITIRFPEPVKMKNSMYTPVKVAKEKGIKVENVAKYIMMEDMKKIAPRLIQALKEDRLTPIEVN